MDLHLGDSSISDSCCNTSECSIIPDELDECYEDSSFDYKNKKLFQYNSLDKENISSNIDNQTINLIKNLNAASKDEYYKERPFATYSRTSTFSEIDKDFGLVNVHRPEIGTARLPLIPLNKTSIENYSNAVHQEAWNESQNIQLSNGSFDHEVVTLKVDINQTTFSNEVFLTNTLDGSVKRLLLNKPIIQNRAESRKENHHRSLKDSRNSKNSVEILKKAANDFITK